MFSPKKTRLLSLLLTLTLLVSFFVGCGQKELPPQEPETEPPVTPAQTEEEAFSCELFLEAVTELSLHTPLQNEYLNDKYENVKLYASGIAEMSMPRAVTFRWSAQWTGYGSAPSSYTLYLAETEDFADPVLVKQTQKTTASANNLKIATQYYWKVTAHIGGKEYTSDTVSFVTGEKGPRTIYVDGVANVRDLGGYLTDSGKRVIQGKLIRCGRLNENNSQKAKINVGGIETMVNTLGVKTEIDLRKPGENGNITQSPLGTGVTYRHVPMYWEFSDGKNILTGNTAGILEAFHILADENNYPIIFHCSIGTDRTGMLAFLVLGLCGVDADTIYRDYLFSNFANIGGSRGTGDITKYMNAVPAGNGGKTLREQVTAYLLGIGVPQSELDAVCRIMVG